jgi:hypothetical protein
MDTISANMSGRNIEHEAIMIEQYGEEILFAGWNPQLTLASESAVAQLNKHVSLLSDFGGMDADAFLKKLYEIQR